MKPLENVHLLGLLDQIEEIRQLCAEEDMTREEAMDRCSYVVSAFDGLEDKDGILAVIGNLKQKGLRSPQNYPLDFLVRCVSADIAIMAGYDSRADWTDDLKKIDSMYHKRLQENRFHL